jgi:hypothetical protein
VQAVLAKRVEHFGFDQGQLLAVLLAGGEGAGAVEVAVADDATPGVQIDVPGSDGPLARLEATRTSAT